MKIKLNEALVSYDSFLGSRKTNETNAEVATEVAAVDTKEPIINDVDAIITSLETLAGQVAETLKEITEDTEVVNEGPADAMVAFLSAMKATKAQKKVNKIKMSKATLDLAADNAPNKEQKEALAAKKEVLSTQITNLQKAVDDRFSGKGDLVDRKLGNAKIEGEMGVLKILAGGDMTKDEAGTAKERMAKLQKRFKDNQEAMKELEPSDEEKKAEAERIKKEKEAADANTDAESTDNTEDEAAAKKKAEDEAAAKKDAEATDNTDAEATDNADDKTKEERQEKNSKDGKLKRLEDLLSSAKESGDDAKIKKIQDMIDKISAKEAWQVEGTELGRLLEMEITKLENEIVLNESKYVIDSVKDRFSRLI